MTCDRLRPKPVAKWREMANKIRGNQDGENGRNESYTIPGRGVVPREQLVEEVHKGKHPNHTTQTTNGEEYVKAKPNGTRNDNVDPNQ